MQSWDWIYNCRIWKRKAIIFRVGGLAIEEIEKVAGKTALRINNSSNPNAPGQLKVICAA